jgi:hypothetical protein
MPADRNCAACTAAAAVNFLNGAPLWTTGTVAKTLDRADGKETMGDGTVEQANTIKKVVHAGAGAKMGPDGGSPHISERGGRLGMPLPMAISEMKKRPDGTVFAVCVDGEFKSGGDACHWLNATWNGGVLRFFDYQSDRTDHTATKTTGQRASQGNMPFHSVKGEFATNSHVYFIAFDPKRQSAGPSGRRPGH